MNSVSLVDIGLLQFPLSWNVSSAYLHFPRNVSISTQSSNQLVLSSTKYGEGNGIPLQYSCLENPMDGGAWWAAVHGVAGSRTRLSDFTFIFHFHALEKEMATHSSILAWRIPGTTGEPGGLPSMGSHRVRHDSFSIYKLYSNNSSLFPTNLQDLFFLFLGQSE